MLTNPLSIISMAANLAINASFAFDSTALGKKYPGAGVKGAVAIGVLDFFLEIFLGGSSDPQPSQVGVTSNELKDDLEKLRQEIDKDVYDLFQQLYLGKMQTIENAYKHAWDAASNAAKSHSGDPVVDDLLNKDWAAYYQTFKDEAMVKSSTTLDVCNWLAKNDKTKYETLSLYMLAAGLYMNICQLDLVTEYNDLLDQPGPIGAPYKKWKDVDMPAWRKDHAAWVAEQQQLFAAAQPTFGAPHAHIVGIVANQPPPGRPEPQMPPRPGLPPTSFDDLKTSVFAQLIRDNVDDFIAWADPIVTDLERKQAARDARLAKQVAAISVLPAGGTIFSAVLDGNTGVLGKPASAALADAQKTLAVGVIKAGIAKSQDEALNSVTADEIVQYRGIIDNWKAAKASYALPS